MSDLFKIPSSHIPERDACARQTTVQADKSSTPEDQELIFIDTGTASADEEEASDAEAVVVDLNEPKERGEPQLVRTGFDGVSREDLRALCRSSELRVRGTKQELLERLSAVEEARA